jgi:hypothetical protein
MQNTKKAVDEFKANQEMKKLEFGHKRDIFNSNLVDDPRGEFFNSGKPTTKGTAFARADAKELIANKEVVNNVEDLDKLFDGAEEAINNVNSGGWHNEIYKKIGATPSSWIGMGSAGDIERLNQSTTNIVTVLERLLGGNNRAMGRLNMIKEAKMGMHLTRETNLKILSELRYLKELAKNRAYFVNNAAAYGVHTPEASNAYNQYIDALDAGYNDARPQDFIPNFDPDKLDQIKFNPMESYEEASSKGGFLSSEELRQIASEQAPKAKKESKTNNKQPENKAKTFTIQDAKDYAKSQKISEEEAIKNYTDSGWKLKDN